MIAAWLMNLAQIDYLRRDLGAALEKAQEALNLRKSLGDRWQTARAEHFIGELYSTMGETGKAEELFRRSLENCRLVGDRVSEARVLDSLADQYSDRGDSKLALETWKTALEMIEGTQPVLEARLLLRIARENLQGEGNRAQALQMLRQSVQIIESLRSQLSESGQRLSFFRQFPDHYDHIVELFLRLGFYAEAFHFTERMKTRTLGDLMSEMDIQPANIPDELFRSYLEMQRKLRFSMESTDSSVRQDYYRLLEQIRSYDSNFVEMQEGNVINLKDFRDKIPGRAVLLEFCVLDTGTLVFLIPGKQVSKNINTVTIRPMSDKKGKLPDLDFWAEEQGIHILTIPDFSMRTLSDLIDGGTDSWRWAYNQYLSDRSPSHREGWFRVMDQTLEKIHSQLFSSILQRLKSWGNVEQLIIIPHRALHLLPLHAAWEVIDDTMKKRVYLSDHFDVSYAPSATVWTVAHGYPETKDQNLMLVENPTEDLLFTPYEVKVIADLFPRSIKLSGSQADYENVRAAMSSFNLLHFSCHGTYNWRHPFESSLLLANGPLRLKDIFEYIQLQKGSLVVLSACETGLTDFTDRMDEYIGLSGGFIYSNAASVVSSLWAVNDYSTALLMENMYKKYKQKKMSISTALCHAQAWLRNLTNQELIEYARLSQREGGPFNELDQIINHHRLLDPFERPFSHPFFWAAFTLVGNSETKII